MYNDFQKAYDNVNHAFLEELLEVYGFPFGVQTLVIEMMARWKIRLSYGAKREVGEVRLTNGAKKDVEGSESRERHYHGRCIIPLCLF